MRVVVTGAYHTGRDTFMRQSPLSCIQPLIVTNLVYIRIYMEVFQKQVL